MNSKESRSCPAVGTRRVGQPDAAVRPGRSAVRWDGGVYTTSDVQGGVR